MLADLRRPLAASTKRLAVCRLLLRCLICWKTWVYATEKSTTVDVPLCDTSRLNSDRPSMLQGAGIAARQLPQKVPEELQSSMRRSGLMYYADARLVSCGNSLGNVMLVCVLQQTGGRDLNCIMCKDMFECHVSTSMLRSGHVRQRRRRQVWRQGAKPGGGGRRQRQEAHLLPGAAVRPRAVRSLQV